MSKYFLFFIIILFSLSCLFAQENDLLDIDTDDLDSLFNEENYTEDQQTNLNETTILSSIKKRGISVNASYYFSGAVNSGWDMSPWEFDGNEQFSTDFGIEMGSSIKFNAQISESFRVLSVFTYQIPDFVINLGDFFFDYNFLNRVYLRAGKYEHGWGISPNFTFTNLLSRIVNENAIPEYIKDITEDIANGPSYIAKFDIPIGIGGLQLLALTRADIAKGEAPPYEYIGYGGKFNLAFTWADFNFGSYYQEFMATRYFLSIKTVLFDFDIYNEWLLAHNNHTDDSVNLSFNIGFARSLFNKKLEVNAEYYYNGEEKNYYFRPKLELREIDKSPFIPGNNFALNLLYRFDGKLNPRIFTRLLYGEESYSLVTGIRINPFSNMEVYFAIPMVIGNKESYYYRNSLNVLNEQRPFGFLLYVKFSGEVGF